MYRNLQNAFTGEAAHRAVSMQAHSERLWAQLLDYFSKVHTAVKLFRYAVLFPSEEEVVFT